jgi:hypothetical protein
VLRTLFRFAPNLESAIRGQVTVTPLDWEREFGLTGGNIFQGAMFPNQLFASRPMPGCGGYRTPIRGLYLCGSAAHPGGAVMGAAGHNAAQAVLTDQGQATKINRQAATDSSMLEDLASDPRMRGLRGWILKQRWFRPVVKRMTTTKR